MVPTTATHWYRPPPPVLAPARTVATLPRPTLLVQMLISQSFMAQTRRKCRSLLHLDHRPLQDLLKPRAASAVRLSAASSRFKACSSLVSGRFGVGFALALLLDHILRRAGDELRVGEFGVELAISTRPCRFPFEPLRSAAMSMMPASGSASVASSSTICTAPAGSLAEASMVSSERGAGWSPRDASPRAVVASFAPEMTSGTLAPGRHVHLSAHRADLGDEPDRPSRSRRRLPRSRDHDASARWRGSGATLLALSGEASFAHSSSVTKGMKGCSSLSARSSTMRMARVSAVAASSAPNRIGLISSRYQSQNLCQTK